jgi:hypothetical protein
VYGRRGCRCVVVVVVAVHGAQVQLVVLTLVRDETHKVGEVVVVPRVATT